MIGKWKTFWQLNVLAIVSFVALHYLGVYIYAVNQSATTFHHFNVASFVAPVVFVVIAILIAIFG